MPVIGISVKQLSDLLGQSITSEKLSDTLEYLGCDVDGMGKTIVYRCPNCGFFMEKQEHEEGPKRCTQCGHEQEEIFASVDEEETIRLDLLPARPDLFDAGGLSRTLKGYLGIEKGLAEFDLAPAQVDVFVSDELQREESYRPYIACAIVRIAAVDAKLLRTIMKLQENLHWGIGRDRKLASIGIYDLDTIKGPIYYKAVAPEELEFYPLGNAEEKMTPKQVLDKHPKGKAYAHLLENSKKYPLLIDSSGQVLSMPPIINSEETRVREGSTNLFIDVTGLTQTDVHKSLNTLVSSLVELGGSVELVNLVHGETKTTTPDLALRKIRINAERARRWLGINFTIPEFKELLEKMRFRVDGRFPNYEIYYPGFRTDIKHEVDIFEDLGIAYGYHNIQPKMVETLTVAQARPEELISEKARQIMLGLGYNEIMSLMLTTEANHFTKFQLTPGEDHAIIENPKLVEHNIVRCHLMTGLFESFVKNKRKPMPQKYFELGNVVHVGNEKHDTNTWEERRLCLAIIGPRASYAEIRSYVDGILSELGWTGTYSRSSHPSFIEGRCAEVEIATGKIVLGEIHPQVIVNFGLGNPIAVAEIPLAVLFK
ncbi:phenylalanine--tRNA ligase subunit beta [Candidatus Uabimicrobium amorphum]|uniref:Phenylalanine--tRNA ligase beta subunit n=1 Tax=Uabimicrobium amorphum TaxID=2596890 RepID=A0A5S9IJX9_UABAM|nr:phenylalanine--tRNA ligase subunit beta [Candidatus Uabimicrobium amorphum]BBM83084.1 phenylalanine--tRNA ligase beta subunit [Candidatus Uabimicrobium amorphum]